MLLRVSTPDPHPSLEHLAFLIGSWEGIGALADEVPFLSHVSFVSDGRPFLTYTARSWLLADDDAPGEQIRTESGFWRPGPEPRDVEVVLAQPDGIVQVLIGSVAFRKIELVSDLVARTTTGREVTASTRLYGGVEEDLAYVIEEAQDGQPLAPVQAVRLSRLATAPPASNDTSTSQTPPTSPG